LNSWDVSNVTTMEGMFWEALAFNGDISAWNVSNVTNTSRMFWGQENDIEFNQDISRWDVSKVTDMTCMFMGAAKFKQDLSGWNVSNVTDMRFGRMFLGTQMPENFMPLGTITQAGSY
jgi:trimeric autotransporter adhesin